MQLLREHQSWAAGMPFICQEKCKLHLADGTFFAAPKYSDQLLTINVLIGKSSIPAAYVVMPNHQQETYSRAFKALFSLDGLKEAAPTSFVTGTFSTYTSRTPFPLCHEPQAVRLIFSYRLRTGSLQCTL